MSGTAEVNPASLPRFKKRWAWGFDVVYREDQGRLVFAAIVKVDAKLCATCVELQEEL